MVKNTKGGNRHKKMARKHTNEETVKVKTRLANPKEPCELYATVTKMFGQGNCEVLCNDNVHRLCVIRKIFKGRNKSSNRITVDTKVLVGLRDWETTQTGKREKCDLLEVYDRNQHKDIKNDPHCNWSVIASSIEKDMIKSGAEEGFEFVNKNYDMDEDSDENVHEPDDDLKGNGETIITSDNEEINFDDI